MELAILMLFSIIASSAVTIAIVAKKEGEIGWPGLMGIVFGALVLLLDSIYALGLWKA